MWLRTYLHFTKVLWNFNLPFLIDNWLSILLGKIRNRNWNILLYKYFHGLRFKCLYKNVSPIRMKTRPNGKTESSLAPTRFYNVLPVLPTPNLKPRCYDDLSSPKLFLLCKRFRNFLFMQLFLPLFDVDFVGTVSVRGLRQGLCKCPLILRQNLLDEFALEYCRRRL